MDVVEYRVGDRTSFLELPRVVIRLDGEMMVHASYGKLRLASVAEVNAVMDEVPAVQHVIELLRTKKAGGEKSPTKRKSKK